MSYKKKESDNDVTHSLENFFFLYQREASITSHKNSILKACVVVVVYVSIKIKIIII